MSPGSLGGRLLALTIVFVLASAMVIFFPSAANFRNSWLNERANAAHLAAIAAELAEDNLSEEAVRELLAGADAMAVARIAGGATELVLGLIPAMRPCWTRIRQDGVPFARWPPLSARLLPRPTG